MNVTYPEDDWLYSFILSYGDKVEVIEPDHIRKRIYMIAGSIQKKYER